MFNLILFIGFIILAVIIMLPILFVSFISSIARIFRVPKKSRNRNERPAEDNGTMWQDSEISQPKTKNKKIFDKDEGEYVSFKEVDEK